jgi:ADP-ribosylation factor-like protein 6
MSGQGNGRSLWKSCCKDCLGLVVVVDATDKDRLDVLKTELNLLLQSMRSNIPILFLANKIDISDGLSVGDCVVGLSLDHIKANHKIFPTSAISGAGIEEAFSWLRYAIVKSSISKVKNSVAKITHP